MENLRNEFGAKSFALGTQELANIIKVFVWTVASALVALFIDWLGLIELPTEYAFVVPLANTVLYSLKEWIADNRFN